MQIAVISFEIARKKTFSFEKCLYVWNFPAFSKEISISNY